MSDGKKIFSHDDVRYVSVWNNQGSAPLRTPMQDFSDMLGAERIKALVLIDFTFNHWEALVRERDLGPILRWCEANGYKHEV